MRKYMQQITRRFVINDFCYELSAIDSDVLLSKLFDNRNIEKLTLTFPMRNSISAFNFVNNSTELDVIRGVATMTRDEQIATMLSTALDRAKIAAQAPPATKTNYSELINKHFKRDNNEKY